MSLRKSSKMSKSGGAKNCDDISDQLQNYTRIGKLGSGGFGTVYKVKNNSDHTQAMKVIQIPENKDNDSTFDMFKKEVKNMCMLTQNCGNAGYCPIIRYIAAGKINDTNEYGIVMHLADGDIENYILEKENINKVDLANKLINAVLWLHSLNLVHGDLKPENILMIKGDIKISDFGLSCFNEGLNCDYAGGTITYMDPLMIAGRSKLNFASDLYSLGVILFEILTGTRYVSPSQAYRINEEFYQMKCNYLQQVKPSGLDGLVGLVKALLNPYNADKRKKSLYEYTFIDDNLKENATGHYTAENIISVSVADNLAPPTSEKIDSFLIKRIQDAIMTAVELECTITKSGIQQDVCIAVPDLKNKIKEIINTKLIKNMVDQIHGKQSTSGDNYTKNVNKIKIDGKYYKVHTGPRGGKYIKKNDKIVYI